MMSVEQTDCAGLAVLDVLFTVQTEIQQHMGLCCVTEIKRI